MFRKEKFPIKIFVFVSLACLVVLGVFLFWLKVNFFYPISAYQNNSSGNRVIYDESDPLITKVSLGRETLNGPIASGNDPRLGDSRAKITIFEFSDFECTYCQEQEEIIRRIIGEYSDFVQLIWKDYPENNPGSLSWQAAIAARCAEEQGAFWPYHDLLYEDNDILLSVKKEEIRDFFISLARDLNLRENLFKGCLDDTEIAELVENNILEAQALGITGIPFIYINEQEVLGQINYEDFKRLAEIELDK